MSDNFREAAAWAVLMLAFGAALVGSVAVITVVQMLPTIILSIAAGICAVIVTATACRIAHHRLTRRPDYHLIIEPPRRRSLPRRVVAGLLKGGER